MFLHLQISTTPNNQKISREFFFFENLLKKFVNPKLDLLIRLPKISDRSLQKFDYRKKQSFSTFGPRSFWKKKKSVKKHGLPALPPVHDKTNEDKSGPLKFGWAGQVTKKPLTDPRPENSKGSNCTGSGKEPKKSKSDKNKKLMVCGKSKGKLSEIDDKQEPELPLISKERFPVDDTLPIPLEEIKEQSEKIKLEEEQEQWNTESKKKLKLQRSEEKAESKEIGGNDISISNKGAERKQSPCQEKTSAKNIKTVDIVREKNSNQNVSGKPDSTSRYLNKPVKIKGKKELSKHTLRKKSKSPLNTKILQTKLSLSEEEKISKEKKMWKEPTKSNIGSLSKKDKPCDASGKEQLNVNFNAKKIKKPSSAQTSFPKKVSCSTDIGKNTEKGLKGQGNFNFMVRPKTTDYKNTNTVGSAPLPQARSPLKIKKPGTAKLVDKSDGKCQSKKPLCQNIQGLNSGKMDTITSSEISTLSKYNLNEGICENHENWIKNKRKVESLYSLRSCVDNTSLTENNDQAKFSHKKNKILDKERPKTSLQKVCKGQNYDNEESLKNKTDKRPKMPCPQVREKSLCLKVVDQLDGKCQSKKPLHQNKHAFNSDKPKTEHKVCKGQNYDPEESLKNKMPLILNASCPQVKDKSLCSKVEENVAEKLESFSQKKCAAKTQSDLKKCDHLLGFKVKEQVEEKQQKEKKPVCSSTDSGKREPCVKPMEKSKVALNKRVIKKSLSSTEFSKGKLTTEKSKSEPCLAEKTKVNKHCTKSKKKRSKSKSCSKAVVPENLKQKDKCGKSFSKMDKNTKNIEKETKFKPCSATIEPFKEEVQCDKQVPDKAENNIKKRKEPEVCSDSANPETEKQNIKCDKKVKGKVDKTKTKSKSSKSCLAENKEVNLKEKSKRSKSKTSTKSKKTLPSQKCAQEKGTQLLESVKPIQDQGRSCKPLENTDCCKMDKTNSKTASKPDLTEKKHQCDGNLTNQDLTKSKYSKSSLDLKKTSSKDQDGVSNKPCTNLNENKNFKANLSEEIKDQGSQCKESKLTNLRNPKRLFKHAVICKKSSSAQRMKKKPKTNILVSSSNKQLTKCNNKKTQLFGLKTGQDKLCGLKNQNKNSKREKMCSTQPLQKKINGNPMKNSKNIQAKSFSQLKTVGSKEQNQLVLYLKNNYLVNDTKKHFQQDQENEFKVKYIMNKSSNNLNSQVSQNSNSNSKIMKPVNPFTLIKCSKQAKHCIENKITMFAKNSTSAKGEKCHSTFTEDRTKNEITAKQKLPNCNNTEITPTFRKSKTLTHLKSINLNDGRTKSIFPKESVIENGKFKADVKRFGILTKFKPISINDNVSNKAEFKGIKESMGNSKSNSFITKSPSLLNKPSTFSNRSTRAAKETILQRYLGIWDQEGDNGVEVLKNGQKDTTKVLTSLKNKIPIEKALDSNHKNLEIISDVGNLQNTSSSYRVNQTMNLSSYSNKALNKHNKNTIVDTVRDLVKPCTLEKNKNVENMFTSLHKNCTNTTKNASKNHAVNLKPSFAGINSVDRGLENKIMSYNNINNCRPTSSQTPKTKNITIKPSNSFHDGNKHLKASKPNGVANVIAVIQQNYHQSTLNKKMIQEIPSTPVKNILVENNYSKIHKSIEVAKVQKPTNPNKTLHEVRNGKSSCNSNDTTSESTPKYKLIIPIMLNEKSKGIDKTMINSKCAVECKGRNLNMPILENKTNSAKAISPSEKQETIDHKNKENKAVVRQYGNHVTDKSQKFQRFKNTTASIKSKDTNHNEKSKDEIEKNTSNQFQNKTEQMKTRYDKNATNPDISQINKTEINTKPSQFKAENNEKTKFNKEFDIISSNKEEMTQQNTMKVTFKPINSRSSINIKRKSNRSINNRALKLRAALKIPQKSKNMFALKKKITVDSYKVGNKVNSSKLTPKESQTSSIQLSIKNMSKCAIRKPDELPFPSEEIKRSLRPKTNDSKEGISNDERENKPKINDTDNSETKTKLRNSTLAANDASPGVTKKNDTVLSEKLVNLVELYEAKKKLTAKILPKPQN